VVPHLLRSFGVSSRRGVMLASPSHAPSVSASRQCDDKPAARSSGRYAGTSSVVMRHRRVPMPL
jgi:hypothetical protein